MIICRGRIDVQATKNPIEKICRISACAAQLVSHIELTHGGHLTEAHTKPISDLQHDMMENMREFDKSEAELRVKAMIKELYKLEKEFPPMQLD